MSKSDKAGRDMPWRVAIEKVLREAGTAMSIRDIADAIERKGYRTSLGATPSNTVWTALSEMKDVAVKTGRGIFMLKETLASQGAPTAAPAEKTYPGGSGDAPRLIDDPEERLSRCQLQAFGVYWSRDMVDWKPHVQLLGKASNISKPVDFGKQIGIYLLFDHTRLVYVGRTAKENLGGRLYGHTRDNLCGRWNRFSWFGLRPVAEDGQLGQPGHEGEWTTDTLVACMEALLIEAFEPPLNRRRGDQPQADEYMQVAGERVVSKKTLAHLMDLMNRDHRD